jgi:hypothetical protein
MQSENRTPIALSILVIPANLTGYFQYYLCHYEAYNADLSSSTPYQTSAEVIASAFPYRSPPQLFRFAAA